MRKIIVPILLSVLTLASAAELQKLKPEEVEDIIFDFRPGIDWKIKEKNIEKLAQQGETVVPILIECLKLKLPPKIVERIEQNRKIKNFPAPMRADGSSIGVQGCAETTLVRIGRPAVPLLIESVEKQPETVGTACRILGRIGDESAIPALIEVIKNEQYNFWERSEAATSLGKLDAEDAIPYLIDALKGQPNDHYNSDKLANCVADSLAKISSQSFGFTFIPEEHTGGKSRTETVPAHYIFDRSPEEKAKVIQTWKDWWRKYGSLFMEIQKFLDQYSLSIEKEDANGISTFRTVDYAKQYAIADGNAAASQNSEIELLLETKSLRSAEQRCKPKEYRISVRDLLEEDGRIWVTTMDSVTCDLTGKTVLEVRRILIRKNGMLRIKAEILHTKP